MAGDLTLVAFAHVARDVVGKRVTVVVQNEGAREATQHDVDTSLRARRRVLRGEPLNSIEVRERDSERGKRRERSITLSRQRVEALVKSGC